jgi:1-acyl-sn-glycerol-3-phosphate acyltransferase
LKYLPIIGWHGWFSESIFIDRAWNKDQKKIQDGLDKIFNDYPEELHYTVFDFLD